MHLPDPGIKSGSPSLQADFLPTELPGKPQNSYQSVQSLSHVSFDPMDFSMSGFPIHHQLLELTQTHIHRVGDVIQPSHPLSVPSPPTFNLSQH